MVIMPGVSLEGATPIGGGVKWRPDLNGGLFGGAEMAAGRNGGAKWRREKDELAAGEMAAPNWRRRNGGGELAAYRNGGVKQKKNKYTKYKQFRPVSTSFDQFRPVSTRFDQSLVEYNMAIQCDETKCLMAEEENLQQRKERKKKQC